MVEENNICAICGCQEQRRAGVVPNYYCRECYLRYRDDIHLNAPWVRYLINLEKQRRKRRNRLIAAKVSLVPVYTSEQLGARYGWG